MIKSVLNKNNLGAILLLNEVKGIKTIGTFYQEDLSNNVILVNEQDNNKRIIIPTINCLNCFYYADLVDNSYYENNMLDKFMKVYLFDRMGAVYVDNDMYYSNNYAMVPFIKNYLDF